MVEKDPWSPPSNLISVFSDIYSATQVMFEYA